MIKLPFANRIAEYFAKRERTAVAVNLIDVWQHNRPLAQLWDVAKFNDEGYRRNSLIFACIRVIASSFCQVPLRAWTVTGEDEENYLPAEHMLVRLLRQPNPKQSARAFWQAYSTHREVAGNVYVLKVRSAAGIPVQLKLLRPDVCSPVPDSNGDIVEYAYGKEPNIQRIPAYDVIHEMANPDPLDPYRGLASIAVLSRMGDLDNFAADYLRAFFLNAGIPSGLLKFKTQTDKSERDRAAERWSELYGGGKQWHKIGVMDQDIEYQEIGSKIRTMDLDGIFGQTETRICSVFDVPPILIGAHIGILHSSYANYEHARKSFYQECLSPKWESASDRFRSDLASEFGANIELGFDTSDVDALQEEQGPIREFALAAWNGGLVTRNIALGLVDLDPIEGEEGDEYKQAAPAAIPPADKDESDEDEDEAQALLLEGEYHDRLLLTDGNDHETHAIKDHWKALHALADKSAPKVKKKFSPRLKARKAIRNSLR